MARKKPQYLKAMGHAHRLLEKFTVKDLQRASVIRGIDFQEMVNMCIPDLSAWFIKNFTNKIDKSRLDDYDDWIAKRVTESMKGKGSTEEDISTILNPTLRLGFIAEKDADGKVIKTKKPRGFSKPKIKRERTKDGIYTGTKKALVFDCVRDGLSKEQTLEKLTEHFEDINAKSIGIWYNRAKKKL